jgi:hypothetical protein
MSRKQSRNPRFDDDLRFVEKPGGPPRYQHRTDKPVQYFTVVDKRAGAILGYVWAGDEDDAAAMYRGRPPGAGG